MENEIQLASSWALASHHGIPMLIHQTTGEGFAPSDVDPFPPSEGGVQSCAQFVIRFAEQLTGEKRAFARQFLSQWPAGPQLETELLPVDLVESIGVAIRELAKEYGHPNEIPKGALAQIGIEPGVAQRCEALLNSEDFPKDAGRAVGKWLWLIGELPE
jgi:hypothetical protein